jgi:hypothetical protein
MCRLLPNDGLRRAARRTAVAGLRVGRAALWRPFPVELTDWAVPERAGGAGTEGDAAAKKKSAVSGIICPPAAPLLHRPIVSRALGWTSCCQPHELSESYGTVDFRDVVNVGFQN